MQEKKKKGWKEPRKKGTRERMGFERYDSIVYCYKVYRLYAN
jgi:hypothetical protein